MGAPALAWRATASSAAHAPAAQRRQPALVASSASQRKSMGSLVRPAQLRVAQHRQSSLKPERLIRGLRGLQAFAAPPGALPRDSTEPNLAGTFSYLPDFSANLTSAPLSAAPRPIPKAVEGAVDDPRVHNPRLRQEMLGTGWMGVIIEYEGIAVEDYSDLHTRAWQTLAVEEGKQSPFQWAMRRAEGMKNEQVVQEVLLWSRAPMEVRRLCARKEELFRELRGDAKPMLPPGTAALLDMLQKHETPVALACSAPEARVRPTLDALGLSDRLAAVVTAEDVARGRPDPEAVLYAAQQMGRPPIRCVLIGNSNASVEAARECGMAVVTVAGRTPVYELTAADLVVRDLSELSFVNLKQLFRDERQVAHQLEEELEEEPQQRLAAPTMTMERY